MIEERGSQKFVKKRTSFGEFLKIIDGLIKTHYGIGQWAKFIALKEKITISPSEYGFNDIDEMFLSINSKNFEIDADKTQIRIVKEL